MNKSVRNTEGGLLNDKKIHSEGKKCEAATMKKNFTEPPRLILVVPKESIV
ncbi:MAG: hypothetical protein JNL70_08340 [Saprospiraceae bacterium]|nr:hypothetical protein [Saprospiraceae bacterium]